VSCVATIAVLQPANQLGRSHQTDRLRPLQDRTHELCVCPPDRSVCLSVYLAQLPIMSLWTI